jgi:hypothetical protein
MTIKYLITRDGREYVLDVVPDWAVDNDEYKVEKLSSEFIMAALDDATAIAQNVTDDTLERLHILEEIYELEENEISLLKSSLEEAVELVESIHEFASKQTNNIMESRGLLLLIAESCDKWLKPR